jgi:hypothetical protein
MKDRLQTAMKKKQESQEGLQSTDPAPRNLPLAIGIGALGVGILLAVLAFVFSGAMAGLLVLSSRAHTLVTRCR